MDTFSSSQHITCPQLIKYRPRILPLTPTHGTNPIYQSSLVRLGVIPSEIPVRRTTRFVPLLHGKSSHSVQIHPSRRSANGKSMIYITLYHMSPQNQRRGNTPEFCVGRPVTGTPTRRCGRVPCSNTNVIARTHLFMPEVCRHACDSHTGGVSTFPSGAPKTGKRASQTREQPYYRMEEYPVQL